MDPASPLLALRLGEQQYALEPDRDYVLGSAADCDLRLPAGAAPHHALLSLRGPQASLTALDGATLHNGAPANGGPVVAGDVLGFGDGVAAATVVLDDGASTLVPLPTLRAAAVERRLAATRIAARALRHPGEQTFQQRVADELRRAPWVATSLALHALVLLLLWLWLAQPPGGGRARATVDIHLAGDPPAALLGPPSVPQIVLEQSPPTFEPASTPQPPAPERDAPTRETTTAAPRPSLRENARIGMPSSPSSTAPPAARPTDHDAGIAGSGEFRKTVSDLRRTGLEVVFVFDSTGSMTSTIADTRATITQMLAVLRALVPDARVGLVTYRDRGNGEQYLVRQVPLGLDFWRAVNFVQFVEANGGGDVPEDVRAGLQQAFAQEWRSEARRVVVLAGDAPPHRGDMARLLSDVRAFAGRGRSFVHTLVTPSVDGDRAAEVAFTEIARAGRGICQRLAERDRVLQRVLTLAFGREFDRDIEQVVGEVTAAAERIDVQALDLARRGGAELSTALHHNPVPTSLWNALVRRPRRPVVEQLIDLLGAPDTPAPTRHALAAALQRVLGLPLPPIDPVDNVTPTQHELQRLRQRAARLPE